MVKLLITFFIFNIFVSKGQVQNTLLPEKCGESTLSNRIIGGNAARLGQFPWIAMLLYKRKSKMVAACGGALINRRYVVTAAHCLPVYSVRLGEHNTNTLIDCENNVCAPPAQDIRVEQNIKHQNYSKVTNNDLHYDIALLRLSRKVIYNDFVKPICLPSDDIVDQEGAYQAAGWGLTNSKTRNVAKVLQVVGLPYFPLRACQRLYSEYGHLISSEAQLCAGGKKRKDTCDGDSGGPLMAVSDHEGYPRYYLVGVVSFGTAECGNGFPGVYTKISYHLKWILENIKQ